MIVFMVRMLCFHCKNDVSSLIHVMVFWGYKVVTVYALFIDNYYRQIVLYSFASFTCVYIVESTVAAYMLTFVLSNF